MGRSYAARRITTVTDAAIYLRISRDDEMSGLAIDRQRDDCERLITDRGWALHETYVDQGISASKRDVARPAYDRMVADYAAGRFTAIVCYDLDRLTRQPRQLEDWIDAAEQGTLKLITASGEADLTTDNGRLFARIKASVARAEIERKGARQRRANIQRAERGYLPPGRRLYGYETNGVTPVSAEADIVRRVFADGLAGSSIRSITHALNAEGIAHATGKTGLWSTKTVRALLTNARYAGIPSAITPIIPRDTFDTVALLLADPARRGTVGNVPAHLASGITTCAVCHEGVTFATKSHSRTPPSYRCPHDHVTIAAHLIEPLLVRGLSEVIAEDAAALLETQAATHGLAGLTAALDRNDAAALAVTRDRDEGLLSAGAARGRLIELRAERVEIDTAVDAARRQHSASGALIALVGEIFDPTRPVIGESLRVASIIAERFAALPLDRQREVLRSTVYTTVYPLRASNGHQRTPDERVRVASRLRVEAL